MIGEFFAELLGTFIFLSIIITSVHSKTAGVSLAWIKIGLALSISILLVGFISGGHLNPAVSLMFYLNNQLKLEDLILYIIAQLIGGSFAYLYYKYLFKNYKSEFNTM
jgi:hypothetical protein